MSKRYFIIGCVFCVIVALYFQTQRAEYKKTIQSLENQITLLETTDQTFVIIKYAFTNGENKKHLKALEAEIHQIKPYESYEFFAKDDIKLIGFYISRQ